MTPQLWLALVLAVLGVLHGPGTQALIKRIVTRKPKR